MMGIYKITNMINGKCYVGASCDIKRRFMEHRTPRNCAKKTRLAKAIRKYGLENFSFEILQECELASLAGLEVFWIDRLKPEYNVNLGGLGNLGYRTTDETRALLSLKGKEQWARKSPEEKVEFAANNLKRPPKGHVIAEATREKIRRKLTGLKQSQETREKRAATKWKPVIRISDQGECEFKSISEAAKAVGVSAACISGVLRGLHATAGGYRWRYAIRNVETIGDECSRVGRITESPLEARGNPEKG